MKNKIHSTLLFYGFLVDFLIIIESLYITTYFFKGHGIEVLANKTSRLEALAFRDNIQRKEKKKKKN